MSSEAIGKSNTTEKTPAERRIFKEGPSCPEPTPEEIESIHDFKESEARRIAEKLDPEDIVIVPGYPASVRAIKAIKVRNLVDEVLKTHYSPWMKITVLKKYVEVYKPLDLSS